MDIEKINDANENNEDSNFEPMLQPSDHHTTYRKYFQARI